MTRNAAAVSGHVPSCVASATPRASRSPCGTPRRAHAAASGSANVKIAATHENESANDSDVTDAGRSAATTIAAAASAFHDARLSRAFEPNGLYPQRTRQATQSEAANAAALRTRSTALAASSGMPKAGARSMRSPTASTKASAPKM